MLTQTQRNTHKNTTVSVHRWETQISLGKIYMRYYPLGMGNFPLGNKLTIYMYIASQNIAGVAPKSTGVFNVLKITHWVDTILAIFFAQKANGVDLTGSLRQGCESSILQVMLQDLSDHHRVRTVRKISPIIMSQWRI